MRRLFALAALLVVLLMPLSVTASDKEVKDEVVDMNDYYSDPFFLVQKGQQIKVDITSNASIDVYIVSSGQLINYPDTFSPQYKVLNTKSAKFTWKQPDDQYYTLIIDNEMNANISGSANPAGPVKFSMTRSDPFTENVQAAVTAVSMFCIGMVVVAIIIVVVIILIIVMLLKKKKEPAVPPQQPYAQQPYQQPPQQQPYPQQPYQQPPQQPQGPPGYVPPPPPPGSMPPQQPGR